MRFSARLSSVSAKVFLAFLAVLASFGGVSAFGAYTMRRLGDEVLRVAGGYPDYLTLRLDLHDLQTRQLNLVRLLERVDDETQRSPGFVKSDVDAARRYRKAAVRRLENLVAELRIGARPGEEARFLDSVAARLDRVGQAFSDNEPLFDRVYGPLGVRPPPFSPIADERRLADTARQRLLAREDKLLNKDLGDLAQELRGRVKHAEAQLEVDERRAVWATVFLALVAAAIGAGVMFLVQRALRPLRRLAAGTQEIARGDYRQRVEVASSDEIGQLAREFNAMAAALEERELRLIRSERLAAVGKIAAQITHEVRNPLSSIGLNAELLDEELGELEGADGQRQLARAIVKEVDRLAGITEQYLRFARLPQPRLEREDLNELVTSLLSFLRGELQARGIELEARLQPALPPVAVDENQLRQALLNVLRNGAEAVGEGGHLCVETLCDEDGLVCVRIVDTGPGIAEADRARIFEPFFSTKDGGTGLGLALTHEIVVEHGGRIDLVSAPGQGTAFTIRLPAHQPQPLVGTALDRAAP